MLMDLTDPLLFMPWTRWTMAGFDEIDSHRSEPLRSVTFFCYVVGRGHWRLCLFVAGCRCAGTTQFGVILLYTCPVRSSGRCEDRAEAGNLPHSVNLAGSQHGSAVRRDCSAIGLDWPFDVWQQLAVPVGWWAQIGLRFNLVPKRPGGAAPGPPVVQCFSFPTDDMCGRLGLAGGLKIVARPVLALRA